MIFHAWCPRATLYRARTTHTSTNWLRPIPTLIWHQLAPIKGTLALTKFLTTRRQRAGLGFGSTVNSPLKSITTTGSAKQGRQKLDCVPWWASLV
jgi:hypothetical protein